mmetsp:Transcript_5283/g.12583  ORF Transcript_5283/g.12583 Transcript_5283/m.12583 type:complete len:83 (-) Transcript_5283:405-653(-)|eukprot:CAMPEP_0116100920 /NCGR_PEP_ID=MMETSP0327-20121206/12537_1 /TAXON_ID=44447 /ORGANISM="Pseudo-nitzschia delicatissima, Strain B596" /LENGTH=82 /DNA_ID=CAMNT_0003592853 /DNA_START=39 /DNA_END=287 /DNA_ORIENTATION=-
MEQAMNNMDYQYDTTCRLSAEDKQMMTRVSSCNRFTETSTGTSLKTNGTSPVKPSLSTTPQDTSFMTEEKLKKIYMPKKIEF